MSSLSQLTSGSALSNLLSMVNPKTLQGTRSSERQDKSQDFETNPSLSETVETTPSPLQAMLRQMTGGNSSLDGDTGSKEEDGMFQMLQNICGRVSQLRVKDNQAQKNIGDAKLPADQTRYFISFVKQYFFVLTYYTFCFTLTVQILSVTK